MILLLVLYTVTLSISLWLAYQLRFDFDVPEVPVNYRAQMISIVLWAIPLKLVLLWFFRQFAGLLSYFSIPDLTRLFYSIGLGSATMAAVRLLGGINHAPPRGVILTDFVLSLLGRRATLAPHPENPCSMTSSGIGVPGEWASSGPVTLALLWFVSCRPSAGSGCNRSCFSMTTEPSGTPVFTIFRWSGGPRIC